MTTAARPTFAPAVGGNSIREKTLGSSFQFSSKDLAAHTKLKLRYSRSNFLDDLSTKKIILYKSCF